MIIRKRLDILKPEMLFCVESVKREMDARIGETRQIKLKYSFRLVTSMRSIYLFRLVTSMRLICLFRLVTSMRLIYTITLVTTMRFIYSPIHYVIVTEFVRLICKVKHIFCEAHVFSEADKISLSLLYLG